MLSKSSFCHSECSEETCSLAVREKQSRKVRANERNVNLFTISLRVQPN